MQQNCVDCGKPVEVGDALIPYGVICDECAEKKGYYDYPEDWNEKGDTNGEAETTAEG